VVCELALLHRQNNLKRCHLILIIAANPIIVTVFGTGEEEMSVGDEL